ncbi:MAG: 50S ribosomal protein L29 [Nanoarchaeota archaeon]|nr:50S ribosomal protein L29 [Nanoarchaeota archaeon]
MKLDTKNMNEAELDAKLKELKFELMKARTRMSSGGAPVKGQPTMRNIKKNIARINTKITEVNKNKNHE